MTNQNVTLNTQQKSFAQALFNAYQTKQPLKRADWEGVVTDDETAYAVQDCVAQLK